MAKNFPDLPLRPPLFYNWKIGIRFELGVEFDRDYNDENSPYVQEVYKRAISLFHSLHSNNEEIIIVVDADDYEDGKTYKHRGRIISPYLYEKTALYKLQHKGLPYVFPEDDEEGKYKTHRFALRCKVSDLRYIPLLKAICNQDLGIQPSVSHRIYFLNVQRQTIFHVYDDRGCDVLAASPEAIKDIYQRYNRWILDYDRAEIDKVFI
ncbi:DUF3885 domain-containing protein [Bacillus sp. ISL-41]|uniref:DUF3885 domain-containing protein n=1 Tax=Bacillus sp. ISL-41 TaxID=2819127 RepID=UPI001BE5A8FD|nr:DUF3885 domain-containing protein [Bacillus sp. ISL-41]MBT2641536.1 DUF3885 domain-containing protein [Bacillus sp. ISL-41]